VSWLRRFRRSCGVLQSPGKTPAPAREHRDVSRDWLLLPLSLFRELAWPHFIHGRAVPLASGVSLARPDLHVFLFGGDGDGFSIGGNHLDHGARKNIRMTYVIMDNFVYGLTKKQTSPTSPVGYKSKTDPTGAVDQPVNPIKKLLAAGATFIARTHATQINHMIQMIERAMDHDGFSVIECLSECRVFPGALIRLIRGRGRIQAD
jgi:pyruvate/2-oxoacid:ferredoxin oxidoreductase beta subunit